MKNKIGIFDSGVGGLTVLQSMKQLLPNEDLIYVGDNANCPYGDKTHEQLLHCAVKIVKYFISRDIKIIVLACNTTSASVLEDLRQLFKDVLIIGVIDSTVQSFLKKDLNHVLVIATNATIQSKKYEQTILSYKKNCQVFSLATPQLVPLIESGEYKNGIVLQIEEALKQYHSKIDSIILGCTHYPIIKNQIKKVLGDIEYISSSDSVSDEVKFYLQEHHLLSHLQGSVEINTTGNVEEFIYAASSFFDFSNVEVFHIDV